MNKRVEVTLVMQMDQEMATRMRMHHARCCQVVIDTLEVTLFTPEERATRDSQHNAHAIKGA